MLPPGVGVQADTPLRRLSASNGCSWAEADELLPSRVIEQMSSCRFK